MLIIIFVTISNNSFRIIKDEYSGPIMVGQSYNFEYKGNVSIEFSNNNVEYKDRKITAINEGTTTITITDKNGKTLYTKTIKVFILLSCNRYIHIDNLWNIITNIYAFI